MLAYSLPYYPSTLPPTKNQGIIMNTQNILDTLIDRTITIIDKGLDRNVGDMNLMQAMEFVGVLMDIRERQQAYERSSSEHVRACGKACTKKPKRK